MTYVYSDKYNITIIMKDCLAEVPKVLLLDWSQDYSEWLGSLKQQKYSDWCIEFNKRKNRLSEDITLVQYKTWVKALYWTLSLDILHTIKL